MGDVMLDDILGAVVVFGAVVVMSWIGLGLGL